MKKYLLFALAVSTLVACDPIKDEGTFVVDSLSAEQLLSGATFKQYNDAACTQEAADGNYIKYNIPNASSVYIYYLKKDGSEFKLQHGQSAGVFCYVPLRGSDPTQTLYFRYVNPDGVETVATRDFTLQVAKELSPEMKLICSNSGKKIWTWDTETIGACWGNMGCEGNYVGSELGNFKWWGVADAAELTGQLNHSDTGVATGEEDNGATMVASEDGTITCYDATGKEIRQGSYNIKDWNPNVEQGQWGVLHTDPGTILFPFEINAGGRKPTDFQIAYLTADRLVLVYPDNGAWDGWSEGTYWMFKSSDDYEGMLTDNASKTWTWDTETIGACWGNMGCEGNYVGSELGNFKWWGVADAAELTGQLNHSDTGVATGEENNDATMIIAADGTIECFDASGNKIRSGMYEVKDWNPYVAQGQWGVLHTDPGTILFPFEINSGGRKPTDFQIGYLSADRLVLVYPDNGAWDGWSEGTYWMFKAK